jgi:hypothetical protein
VIRLKPRRGGLFIETNENLHYFFVFQRRAGRTLSANCGISPRAAEKQKEVWMSVRSINRQLLAELPRKQHVIKDCPYPCQELKAAQVLPEAGADQVLELPAP